MTPQDFIKKWKSHALTERASAQEHFIDLCRLFDHPTPAEDDPKGERFTFEKGAAIVGGGDGWADVWKKGFFAWEYKKRRRNLDEAMAQLARYAAALDHPPLLVVCDTIRFQILTTWTNLETKKYSFELEELAEPEKFHILRAVFHDPDALRPVRTRAMITAEAAKKFQAVSDALQSRNLDREAVAHFVNQLVFCFLASRRAPPGDVGGDGPPDAQVARWGQKAVIATASRRRSGTPSSSRGRTLDCFVGCASSQ